MIDRLFFLWRVLNRLYIVLFSFLTISIIFVSVEDYGLEALLAPIELLNDSVPRITTLVFLASWLIGWITTGRHAWNIGKP